MKTSLDVPEMAYAPQYHDRQQAADPVLGYRVYPPSAKQRDSSHDLPRSPHNAHFARGRLSVKSDPSSVAGSISSSSEESVRSDDRKPNSPEARKDPTKGRPQRLSYLSVRDVESQPQTPFTDPFRSPVPVSLADVTTVPYSEEQEEEDVYNRRTLRICIYLSGVCSLVCLMNAFWVFLAIIIAILLQPLRLCSYRQTFHEELISFLAPPLNMQLRFIYSPISSDRYDLSSLIMIHLLSPILSLGAAVAAWTAAFFWFYAAILGDPTKTDKRSDGKTTVLGIRAWWERWLVRGFKQ